MSGHSKWANIKHKKAKVDAQKGAIFTKYSKELIMAAKLGGSDPDGNFRLRTAIAAAKSVGIPNDNIKRAIDKGCGVGSSSNLENIDYEGYGPGGVAVIIETLTDNRNRTAGDIRSYFNKNNGNLGETGCVSWMFDSKGIIIVNKGDFAEDDLFEVSLNAGAEDFIYDEDSEEYKIFSDKDMLQTVAEVIEKQNYIINSVGIDRIPTNTIEVTDKDDAKYLLRLLDSIESHDDVQKVYANFEMSDELMEAASI